MAQVLDYVQRLHVDQGGSNLLRALSWVYHQPTHRSCPRQLFILTDDSLSNVGQVLELVRRNTSNARCFALGLGSRACRRLLHGVAKLTGGRAEFLCDDERLLPKLMKCLKKALEPALTDVRIDWYVPENMEALLSPNEIPTLYPGSRLIGYCTLYDVSTYKVKKNDVKNPANRLLPHGSFGSVFEVSPGSSDLAGREGRTELGHEEDTEHTLRAYSQEISSEFSCAPVTDNTATDAYTSSDVRWRMEQTSYVQEQYTLTRCSLGSEKCVFPFFTPLAECLSLGLDTASLPHGLDRVQPQHSHSLTCWDTSWKQNITSVEADPGKARPLLDGEGCVLRQKILARAALAGRSFSSPQGDLDMHRLRKALERVSFEQAMGGRLEESDTETENIQQGALSLRDSNGFLFPTSPLDWDGFTDPESIFAAAPVMQVPCRSVIHGLLGSKPMSWEVSMDLCVLWSPEEAPRDTWDEIVHHLAARSVILDFENMAEKQKDIEHGSSKRYRMKAIQTSKSCGIISMYTTFSTTDVSPRKMFSKSADIRHTGVRLRSRHNPGSRSQRAYSFGCRPSTRDSQETDASHNSTVLGPGSPSDASSHSQRSSESRTSESFFSSRFNLGRLRPSHTSGRQPPLQPHCLFAESETQKDFQSPGYLTLLHLQLASGAFLLSESFSECIHIPLDRLKRASPYLIHRRSLSPLYHSVSSSKTHPIASHRPGEQSITCPPHASSGQTYSNESFNVLPQPFSSEKGSVEVMEGHPQGDSGRGSETDMCEETEPQGEVQAQLDMESSSWATSVALAWLEHHCAGFFVEWELVAAKADFWLKCQSLPESVDLPGLKAAARQLFLLLRHWDENLQLNMLCYNPNTM